MDGPLKVGLVMNPVAGIGGPAALKGSDGSEIPDRAIRAGARSQVLARTRIVLRGLESLSGKIHFYTCQGVMGEAAFAGLDLHCTLTGGPIPRRTSSRETRSVVRWLEEIPVDLLLFAGGDGTARDICEVMAADQVVLGIPCGVKMHSGVFATSPADAARIVCDIVSGRLTSVVAGEVRDIDEEAFREGKVRSRYFGEMLVPRELRYVQQTKIGGIEQEELVLVDIAAWIIEEMDPGICYVMGPGTTTAAIMAALDLPNTLLGVDVVRDHELVLSDASETELYSLLSSSGSPGRIIVTAIGGQGHILGRGNQQLSPGVIRKIGKEGIIVVATKAKLKSLEGRPLRVDTGDPELDRDLSGLIRVVTGYEDSVLYRVC